MFTIKQAFMVHIPGFDNGTGEHPTISFESACAPSHFVRQKNYKFVLGKKGDTKFGKFIWYIFGVEDFHFRFFFYELMIKFLVDFSLVYIFKGKRGICLKLFPVPGKFIVWTQLKFYEWHFCVSVLHCQKR